MVSADAFYSSKMYLYNVLYVGLSKSIVLSLK